VGYLLDQIRANGEKKELVDEVVILAKKYGIATPYTSYLIVPDAPVPVVATRTTGAPGSGFSGGGGFQGGGAHGLIPPGLAGPDPTAAPAKVADFAKEAQKKPGDLAANRGRYEESQLRKGAEEKGKSEGEKRGLREALDKKQAYDQANAALTQRDKDGVQTGKLGVDLSVQMNNLRNQYRLERTAQCQVAGRNCIEIGGVWIDENYDAKMTVVAVKAMSDAYFRILERHPKVKDVFRLGNHLVWVTPNGTALIIDTGDGKDKLTDAEIDTLFVAKK
jgi:Ca-activated chloride channel family protein